jgi:hypothetical protein
MCRMTPVLHLIQQFYISTNQGIRPKSGSIGPKVTIIAVRACHWKQSGYFASYFTEYKSVAKNVS